MRGIHLQLFLIVCSGAANASERHPIEEIIVTAQRIEESASKVPISISAFTEAMIDDRQIIGISDLQINVPNLTYIPEPFAGPRVTIRGVGVAPTGNDRAAAGPSAPFHLNGISAPVDVSIIEFFDLDRVEVLRGPQGTLYGRNATAGAINLVTRKPHFDGSQGYVDLEYGDYEHFRAKGAANLVISDTIALRLAGMTLNRDGYIENKAAEEIPGIHSDIDDRDLNAYRATATWQPTSALKLWLMYGRFKEDDSKVRITNVVCRQSNLPNLGCEPDAFGLDLPNSGAVLGTLLAGVAGAIDPGQAPSFEYPRPRLDLREHHSDFNPRFKYRENVWMLGGEWNPSSLAISATASHFDSSRLSQQDFLMDVGSRLNPNPLNPEGLWPTSRPSGGPGALRGGGPCDLEAGRAGIAGGCTLGPDLNRGFAYDQVDEDITSWGVELQARSDFDGRFNFLLGANYLHIDKEGDVYTLSNLLDTLGLVGFPPVYPSFVNFANQSESKNYAAFGEAYLDLTDQLKLTVGLRYNHDRARNDLASTLYTSIDVNPLTGGALGTDPVWVRSEMATFLPGSPVPPSESALALADYYNAGDAIRSADTLDSLIAALQLVPIAPRFGEGQDLAGLPRSGTWDDVSGRIGLDWLISDDAMIYLFFTQGYRPGGLNVNQGFDPKYASERINAIELGSKARRDDGSLAVNAVVFYNDHKDLQITRSLGAGSITENLDARTLGLELEVEWRTLRLPGLAVDLAYAWLNSEVKDDQAIDFLSRAQGNPSFVNLKNSLPGPNDGYIAPTDQVLPLVIPAVNAGAADPRWGSYDNGIPVYFSREYLAGRGVQTSDGIPADLDGNELPNAPEHSIRLGLAYTWTLFPGALTLRYDCYWQDDSYGREFNTRGDKIDSWTQQNASIIFENATGRWSARAWIRNLTNDTIVMAHSLTNDLSGNFRQYYLAEPRIFGASVRYNFGSP